MSVCAFVSGDKSVCVCVYVFMVSEERNREQEGRGEGGRRGSKGNRLAVKYCGVCQLHHDVLGITRSLITLN